MRHLMKKYFCFLLAGLLLASILADSPRAQTETEIVKIRSHVATINKGLPKFKKTTKDVEGISLEGTEATYYLAGKAARKITANMYGETYRASGEFYYQNGQLIFAFLRHSQYDTQIGLSKPPKVVRTEERRFYFADGELIRLLVGKIEVKDGDERYGELKDEIINISGKLKN